MAYIEWTPEFDLGIDETDRQHRRLVEVVNRVHEAMELHCPKCVMQAVVGDLVTYMEFHFAYEEQLLQRLRYPGRQLHRGEYMAMTRELKRFENALADGRAFASANLMGSLRRWLLDHMVRSDRAYANHECELRTGGVLALCG